MVREERRMREDEDGGSSMTVGVGSRSGARAVLVVAGELVVLLFFQEEDGMPGWLLFRWLGGGFKGK
ncbi:hypothetical protein, partial [Enterococcus faecium]|uniref:hypothetical protein n=1 Tax=Enterococcus faecium TaxID=1352 RepID=UPI000FC39908